MAGSNVSPNNNNNNKKIYNKQRSVYKDLTRVIDPKMTITSHFISQSKGSLLNEQDAIKLKQCPIKFRERRFFNDEELRLPPVLYR